MVTATMLHVVDCLQLNLRVEYQNQLLGILGIDKDKVDECCELNIESATTRAQENRSNKRRFSSIPGSPNGVMDVSFSSDSSNDSWSVSSPEQQSKKSRIQQEQLPGRLNHAPSDFLSIPR